MYRYLLGTALLFGSFAFTGCSPAEVQPPAEAIPSIPAPRGAEAGPAAGGGGGAAPAGRTPAMPK